MAEDNSKRKILYLEATRIFAILCVMFTHSGPRGSNYYQYTDSIPLYIWSLSLELLSDIGVPLFFMVSGVLLLKKEEPTRSVYTGRIPRMLAVLVLFSFIRYLYECFLVKTMTFSVTGFLMLLWKGELFLPFWFLYTYISILLFLPFFRRMARNLTSVEGKTFLLVCLFWTVLIPILMSMFGAPTGFAKMLETYVISMMTGYILEYVLEIKWSAKYVILFSLLAMIVSITLMMAVEPLRYMLLFPVTTGAFLIIKCIPWDRFTRLSPWLIRIGSCTFGLYLIEDYLRNLFGFVYDKTCGIITPILANALWLLVVFCVGIVIVSLLKKIPGIRKLI